jgi:hypothetical protein
MDPQFPPDFFSPTILTSVRTSKIILKATNKSETFKFKWHGTVLFLSPLSFFHVFHVSDPERIISEELTSFLVVSRYDTRTLALQILAEGTDAIKLIVYCLHCGEENNA